MLSGSEDLFYSDNKQIVHMKKSVLSLILSTAIISSCGTLENEAVEDIKSEELVLKALYFDRIPHETVDFKLSDIFTGFEIIPLETSDECLVPYINWVYLTGKNMFTCHQNVSGREPGPASLLRFDRYGNFQNRIGSGGRGPGEHLGYSLNNLIADDEEEVLYVDWQPDSMDDELMHYLYDGTFIREISLPMESLHNKTKYSDNIWFATGSAAGKQNYGGYATRSDSVQVVFFKDNGEVTKIVPRTVYPPPGPNKYSPLGGADLCMHNNVPVLYMGGVDTIFRIIENNLIPSWVLHRGKDGIPYNVNIDREAISGKHIIKLMAETDNNLILLNLAAPDIKALIVDKTTNKAAYVNIVDDVFGFLKPEEFKFLLMRLKDNRISVSWDSAQYLKILKENNVDPAPLLKYSPNQERLRNITSESNPVIITFTLKDHIKL